MCKLSGSICSIYLYRQSKVQGGDCYLLHCRHAVCGPDTHTAAGCCLLSLPLLSLQPFCWLRHDSTQHAWLVVSPYCSLLGRYTGMYLGRLIPMYLPLMLELRTGCLACVDTARHEWQHKFCNAFNTHVHSGLHQMSLIRNNVDIQLQTQPSCLLALTP